MKRSRKAILTDINYYIDLKNYLVNRPIVDYPQDMAVINLALDKLNALQKEYSVYQFDFVWADYQFNRVDPNTI